MYLLDKAFDYLDKLNKEACFIIECRLVDGMSWNNIDISFNEKFRAFKTIGYDRMRHLMYEGLRSIIDYIESIPSNRINYFHNFKRKCFEVSVEYDLKIHPKNNQKTPKK